MSLKLWTAISIDEMSLPEDESIGLQAVFWKKRLRGAKKMKKRNKKKAHLRAFRI